MVKKYPQVGVLMGGFSSERRISLKSGRAILASLKRSGVSAIAIDPRHSSFLNKLKKVKVVFIALHGEYGEDGQIQRLLEKKKIAYTGSTAAGCVISFDKLKTKRILQKKSLSTPAFRILTRTNWQREAAKFQSSFFIKPLTEGSSVGVEMIQSFQKEKLKVEKLVKKYGIILAESRVVGREITAGIVGEKKLPVVEIRTRRAFYDFKAKYTPGFTEYITEHGLPQSVVKHIQNIALKVFKALGLRDLARIDMMLDAQNRPFVLEANSIPGFTEISLLPKAARKIGISFDQLVLKILDRAVARIKA